jgi:hypothetical protein
MERIQKRFSTFIILATGILLIGIVFFLMPDAFLSEISQQINQTTTTSEKAVLQGLWNSENELKMNVYMPLGIISVIASVLIFAYAILSAY